MKQLITPGKVWNDTDGKPIQAHGGSILYHEDTYYLYGENKEKTYAGSGIWHFGVRCYSSKDLYNWKDEGIILRPVEDDIMSPLHPKRIIDRPHILYNKFTEKFVMWVKLVGSEKNIDDWSIQFMGIAVSDSIKGPFKLVKTTRPLGMEVGDFDLYADPRDGKAYFIFGRVHTEIVIADLTDDYMDVTSNYSSHFAQAGPPTAREAPAFFKKDSNYYMLTSGTTGYIPNPTEVGVAELMHGPWKSLGEPCLNDVNKNSFDCQFSSVFRHPFKKGLYIAIGDRWMAGDKFESDARKTNTAVATYVWLPILFSGDTPHIEWRDEWKIEDFEDKMQEHNVAK